MQVHYDEGVAIHIARGAAAARSGDARSSERTSHSPTPATIRLDGLGGMPHLKTRIVSVAGIRLDSWKSARAFKGIICDDISEFESYMPSHAVGSPPANTREGSERCRRLS